MLLEVKEIQKSFQNTEVLKNISFSLEKGKVLSIIGSSGSGKTTLLRCLNFLETPDAGSITLNGNVLWDGKQNTGFTDDELREKRLHFGLVFQQFNLFPQYTVLKNITLAPELLYTAGAENGDREKLRADIEKNGRNLLSKVGLLEKVDAYPHQLSGGQQQRVAIARALALKPDILCFDEPTSALDPELTGEVLRVIRSLKNADTTMIIVTHEMKFAEEISDCVIFMRDGIIEAQGSPKEIFGGSDNRNVRAFLQITDK